MNMEKDLKVNIKKLIEGAVIPSYAKNGDAGMDLTAVSKSYDEQGNIVYGTGLAFEIPDGYVGLVFPRSSLSKKDLALTNHVGVIDSGYRGEVSFKFKPTLRKSCWSNVVYAGHEVDEYYVGDRIGQIIIMPYPKVQFNVVDILSDTERGSDGFGSTGNGLFKDDLGGDDE